MKFKCNAIETRAADLQLNYKQLATAAGVTEKTLYAARSGAAIRTDTAGRIAAALGVSVSELKKGDFKMYQDLKAKCEEMAAEFTEIAEGLDVNDQKEWELRKEIMPAIKACNRICSTIDAYFAE